MTIEWAVSMYDFRRGRNDVRRGGAGSGAVTPRMSSLETCCGGLT